MSGKGDEPGAEEISPEPETNTKSNTGTGNPKTIIPHMRMSSTNTIIVKNNTQDVYVTTDLRLFLNTLPVILVKVRNGTSNESEVVSNTQDAGINPRDPIETDVFLYDTDDGETEESSGVGGIPTGAVIAIFVILILITLIVVDVYCYVRKGCGVIYTIRTALCAGDDSSAPISDIEAGDKAGEPLLEKKEPLPPEEENKAEEELVEKEPDDKVDTPIIKLEEPEDMDGVEKGELETEEKGEEGGKAE